LIDAICNRGAESVFSTIRAEKDNRNVCGLPPIYVAMRLLGDTHGTLAAYDRCPADQNNTSFVSICGVVWS
jgi:MEMO1 family protein